MKKNRIEENKTDKHLAEKNQIEKNLIVDRLTVTYGEKLAVDRKSTRLNSSHASKSRMPSSA